MNGYQQQTSTWDKLTGTMALSPTRAAVIKQTYILFSVSVACAMAGGYIGATSPTLVNFFSGWMGWIAAIAILNILPHIAIAARSNPVLGVSALVFDGFFSGIALSPLLYYATMVAPTMIVAAIGITGFVFLGVTTYIMTSGRTFSAPKGMMMGMFFTLMGAMILNSFMHIGVLGILISLGIGAMGVCSLVYSTSSVLGTPDADSPIPGALMLFAGVFNIFVSALNLLLRLFGGGSRD